MEEQSIQEIVEKLEKLKDMELRNEKARLHGIIRIIERMLEKRGINREFDTLMKHSISVSKVDL